MNRKSVIVTGAGTGIGRAVSLKVAKAGCAVTLTGRRRQPLDEVAAQIADGGGHARGPTRPRGM